MNSLEEIKKLQTDGKTEEEIREMLKERGLDEGEITQGLSQIQIKQAVDNEDDIQERHMTEKIPEEMKGMQPSILGSENAPPPQEEEYVPPAEPQPQEGYQSYSDYQQPPQNQYPQYQPTGVSTDTITEIADQIVTEKISSLKNEIDRMKDIGNAIESKVEYVDERLKKIEKVIDRLQLSILQKVGEYVNNVDDIKKELIETQKSFKSLLPSNKKVQ